MSFPVTGSKLVQVTHESDLSRKKNKKQVINTYITLLSQKWIYWTENIISLQSKVISVSRQFSQFLFLDLPNKDPSSRQCTDTILSSIQGYQQWDQGIVQLNDIFHKQAACCCFFYCISPMPSLHQRTPMWIFIYRQMREVPATTLLSRNVPWPVENIQILGCFSSHLGIVIR